MAGKGKKKKAGAAGAAAERRGDGPDGLAEQACASAEDASLDVGPGREETPGLGTACDEGGKVASLEPAPDWEEEEMVCEEHGHRAADAGLEGEGSGCEESPPLPPRPTGVRSEVERGAAAGQREGGGGGGGGAAAAPPQPAAQGGIGGSKGREMLEDSAAQADRNCPPSCHSYGAEGLDDVNVNAATTARGPPHAGGTEMEEVDLVPPRQPAACSTDTGDTIEEFPPVQSEVATSEVAEGLSDGEADVCVVLIDRRPRSRSREPWWQASLRDLGACDAAGQDEAADDVDGECSREGGGEAANAGEGDAAGGGGGEGAAGTNSRPVGAWAGAVASATAATAQAASAIVAPPAAKSLFAAATASMANIKNAATAGVEAVGGAATLSETLAQAVSAGAGGGRVLGAGDGAASGVMVGGALRGVGSGVSLWGVGSGADARDAPKSLLPAREAWAAYRSRAGAGELNPRP
jgi:hypothetical protein